MTRQKNVAELYTSLPTYNSLVEMIQMYLNRYDEDTLAAIPFFVNAAEKTILRGIRMPALEKIVKFTINEDGNGDGSWVELPFDYLEMKFVWIEGDAPGTLQRVSFDQLIRGGSASLSGRSIPIFNGGGGLDTNDTVFTEDDYNGGYWAINGTRMYIRGVDINQDIFMTYYKDIEEINSETQTNPLLELIPDAFLYFAVAEGFRFLMEPEKGSYWEGEASKRMQAIYDQVENAEFAGGPLTISPI